MTHFEPRRTADFRLMHSRMRVYMTQDSPTEYNIAVTSLATDALVATHSLTAGSLGEAKRQMMAWLDTRFPIKVAA